MTLAIALVTREIAIIGADRLYSGANLAHFSATKICRLETSDAQGFITYAGVGARPGRDPFELSEWITWVLRGVDRNLDQSLDELMQVAERQFRGIPQSAGHTFVFAGFREKAPTLQVITRHNVLRGTNFRTPKEVQEINIGDSKLKRVNIEVGGTTTYVLGSGAREVKQSDLLALGRIVRGGADAHQGVRRAAAKLAQMIQIASRREPTVGAASLCAWIPRDGGGAHAAFGSDAKRLGNTELLPNVTRGAPISDVFRLIGPSLMEQSAAMFEAMQEGREASPPDMTQVNELLKTLQREPREKF
jgi:hypothetical protein